MSLRAELRDSHTEAERLGLTQLNYGKMYEKSIENEQNRKEFIEVKEKNIEDILNNFKEHIKFFSGELLIGKSIDSTKVESAILYLVDLAYDTCVLSRKSRRDFLEKIIEGLKKKFEQTFI